MAHFALVAKLSTRWQHLNWLQIWPPDGTTGISYKFSHQVESLALVAKLSTKWRHLHQFQICPPDGATRNSHLLCIESITCKESITCITCKTSVKSAQVAQFVTETGHQVTSLALLGSKVGLQVVSLALPNSLGLPYWHYQLVLS